MNALADVRVGGLCPEERICVGPGFSREEVKDALLARGEAFVGGAVLSLEELAALAAGVHPGRTLAAAARQEVLRALLAVPRIAAPLLELKRLRRQSGFLMRLDRAVESGRMASAHAREAEAISERARERLGESPTRGEVRGLTVAYEAWLRESGYWDLPLLLREAAEKLVQRSPPGLPKTILHLTAQVPESLEQQFWERLGQYIDVRRRGPLEAPSARAWPGVSWSWERWHTVDDGAEEVASALAASGPSGWSDRAVLLPDDPSVRRSLLASMERHRVPLEDPRDPTALRTDEAIKATLSPLEMVAGGFEKDAVAAWLLSSREGTRRAKEVSDWLHEIEKRGIRRGFGAYRGGALQPVADRLAEAAQALGGRRTCRELGGAHLEWLERGAVDRGTRERLSSLWGAFIEDVERAGWSDRAAPAKFWHERLRERLSDAKPAPLRLRAAPGVPVYRLAQAPLRRFKEVVVLGLPSRWLEGEGGAAGDYWYGERERDALAVDFGLRCRDTLRTERLAALRAWAAASDHVRFVDVEYDWDGGERESLAPALRLLTGETEPEVQDRGASRRWLRSFTPPSAPAPRLVRLDAGERVLSATDLDHQSRCGFLGLARARWKLRDPREADSSLWSDARGNILHAAVKTRVESRREDGTYGVSLEQALDAAWESQGPRGMFRSDRLIRDERRRLLQVLRRFDEEEAAYLKRCGARTVALEGPELRFDPGNGIVVTGIPDRVDETDAGLFVIDYKTGTTLPTGTEMLEAGYRLQLPYYAVALRQMLAKPVIGAQFVGLNSGGRRTTGIFFTDHAGKSGKAAPAGGGQPVVLGANSGSRLERAPEEVWDRFRELLGEVGGGLASGVFEARPRDLKERECEGCAGRPLCQLDRAGAPDGDPE